MNEVVSQRTRNANEKFCCDCGNIINIRAEICPKCGIRQMAAPQRLASATNSKDRVVAAVLAFFLGGFGIHKFYLDRIGLGIVYLIFFWTFIPAIIAFIEFIILLLMRDEDFDRKYNRV